MPFHNPKRTKKVNCRDCGKECVIGRDATLCHKCRVGIFLKTSNRPKKLFTKEMDDLIIEAWTDPVLHGKGAYLLFKERFPNRFSPSQVCKRAMELGVARERYITKPWGKAELDLLVETEWMHPESASKAFSKAGFKRTITAIGLMRTRMACCGGDGYSMNELGLLIGSTDRKIASWIHAGQLKAARRKVESESGEWYISRDNLRNFVLSNVSAVELAKVDKLWFIDLLCPGQIEYQIRKDLLNAAKAQSRLERASERM